MARYARKHRYFRDQAPEHLEALRKYERVRKHLQRRKAHELDPPPHAVKRPRKERLFSPLLKLQVARLVYELIDIPKMEQMHWEMDPDFWEHPPVAPWSVNRLAKVLGVPKQFVYRLSWKFDPDMADDLLSIFDQGKWVPGGVHPNVMHSRIFKAGFDFSVRGPFPPMEIGLVIRDEWLEKYCTTSSDPITGEEIPNEWPTTIVQELTPKTPIFRAPKPPEPTPVEVEIDMLEEIDEIRAKVLAALGEED